MAKLDLGQEQMQSAGVKAPNTKLEYRVKNQDATVEVYDFEAKERTNSVSLPLNIIVVGEMQEVSTYIKKDKKYNKTNRFFTGWNNETKDVRALSDVWLNEERLGKITIDEAIIKVGQNASVTRILYGIINGERARIALTGAVSKVYGGKFLSKAGDRKGDNVISIDSLTFNGDYCSAEFGEFTPTEEEVKMAEELAKEFAEYRAYKTSDKSDNMADAADEDESAADYEEAVDEEGLPF